MIEDRMRVESRTYITAATVMILTMFAGLWDEHRSTRWFSAFFIALMLFFIWLVWHRGELRLDDRELEVRGYGRSLRIPRDEIVSFERRRVSRGPGKVRDQIWVNLVDGRAERLESIHGPPGSTKIAELVDRLNASIDGRPDPKPPPTPPPPPARIPRHGSQG